MRTYLIQSTENQFYATLGRSKNEAFENVRKSFTSIKFKKSSVKISSVHFDYVKSAVKDYLTYDVMKKDAEKRADEMQKMTYKMMAVKVSDEIDAKINTPYI